MRRYTVTIRKVQTITYELEAESLSQALNRYPTSKVIKETPLEVVGMDVISESDHIAAEERFRL